MADRTGWAIDLSQVTKIYNRRVHALRGIDLQVRPGEIFGLLGPNGAGKSTLVKIIMTVVRPTRAEGTILGRPVGHKPTLARIGYLPENHRFPRYLTGRQTLEFFAALSKVDRATARQRTDELLAAVRMTDWAKQKIGTYSKGMLQRIGLAQALVSDPDLVLLDEPTDGVDPVGRREILDALGRLRGQGKTIFINSHALSELESICDRVAILVKGQVAKQGTIDELTFARHRYEIEVAPVDPRTDGQRLLALFPAQWKEIALPAARPPAWPPRIGQAPVPGAFPMTPGPNGIPVPVPMTFWRGMLPDGPWIELRGPVLSVGTIDPAPVQPMLDALRGAGFVIRRLQQVRPSLEDLFMEAITDPTTGQVATPGAASAVAKVGAVP